MRDGEQTEENKMKYTITRQRDYCKPESIQSRNYKNMIIVNPVPTEFGTIELEYDLEMPDRHITEFQRKEHYNRLRK
jgi:hypothetical protein